MKSGIHTRRFLLLVSTLFLLSCNSETPVASGQNNNAGDTSQEKLIKAQTENFQAQTAKLNREKGIVTQLIGLGTFFAALIALTTFLLNYSATLQAQRDTQFYEALKRFGDKDSPTLRSSAAGVIVQMAVKRSSTLRGWVRKERQLVYLETALNQLIAGLLLEENSVALNSISAALEQLTAVSPLEVLTRAYKANLKLQKDMLQAIARYFSTLTTDESSAVYARTHWNELAAVTPYEEDVIHDLALRHQNEFTRSLKAAINEFNTATAERKLEYGVESLKALKLASQRLQVNVEICCGALRQDPFRQLNTERDDEVNVLFKPNSTAMDLSDVFLVNGDLRNAKLQGTRIEKAQLQQTMLWHADMHGAFFNQTYFQGANMSSANLKKSSLFQAKLYSLEIKDTVGRTYFQDSTSLGAASLREANLNGASLVDAILTAADLWNAKISKETDFRNANWWQANYRRDLLSSELDSELLGSLYDTYKDSLPSDLSSVYNVEERNFLADRRKKDKNGVQPTVASNS